MQLSTLKILQDTSTTAYLVMEIVKKIVDFYMGFFSEELVLKDSQDTIGSWEDDILCVLVDLLTKLLTENKCFSKY